LKIANPNRAVITSCDEIDELVTVAGLDLELGVSSRHFRHHGSEVGRSEGQRHGNAQASAKLSGRQDRLFGYVDLGADPRSIVSERRPGFR
jgi:hypothetical protein